MASKRRTISVRMNEAAKQRVERAAKLMKQSSGAFMEKAGEEQARSTLLKWALERHRQGESSFSELAQESGLAVEEIMIAAGDDGREEALRAFLASCRAVADVRGDSGFFHDAEAAVRAVREADRGG